MRAASSTWRSPDRTRAQAAARCALPRRRTARVARPRRRRSTPRRSRCPSHAPSASRAARSRRDWPPAACRSCARRDATPNACQYHHDVDDRSNRQIARQRRRAAGDRSATLAAALMKLGEPALRKLDLDDDDLRDAIDRARAVTSHIARRRAERALAGELRALRHRRSRSEARGDERRLVGRHAQAPARRAMARTVRSTKASPRRPTCPVARPTRYRG